MKNAVAPTFLIGKRQPAHGEWQQWPFDEEALLPGQVLLRVERSAFAANNVTYASLGDAMLDGCEWSMPRESLLSSALVNRYWPGSTVRKRVTCWRSPMPSKQGRNT